jgi:hypothetical protein
LRDNFIQDVYICGLAYDYCVRYSAIDAINEGFRTFVIEDACRAITPQGNVTAKEKMLAAGVVPTTSTVLTVQFPTALLGEVLLSVITTTTQHRVRRTKILLLMQPLTSISIILMCCLRYQYCLFSVLISTIDQLAVSLVWLEIMRIVDLSQTREAT